MKSLSTWLLGGALLASLGWNLELGRAPAAEPDCSSGAGCGLDATCMDLDPQQRARLAALCARSCGESDQLERRADELQRELLASLAAPEVDRAAVGRLIGEVAELRERSLAACVEGILGVRELLGAGEVRALVERCGTAPANGEQVE